MRCTDIRSKKRLFRCLPRRFQRYPHGNIYLRSTRRTYLGLYETYLLQYRHVFRIVILFTKRIEQIESSPRSPLLGSSSIESSPRSPLLGSSSIVSSHDSTRLDSIAISDVSRKSSLTSISDISLLPGSRNLPLYPDSRTHNLPIEQQF